MLMRLSPNPHIFCTWVRIGYYRIVAPKPNPLMSKITLLDGGVFNVVSKENSAVESGRKRFKQMATAILSLRVGNF